MQDLTVWSVVGLGFGLTAFFHGFRRLRIMNRIRSLPPSRVRSMAMGPVELDGHVRVETPVTDPVFGNPCAYYRVVVEEQRGSGRDSHWVTIYNQDSSATPFLIEDATGVARVCPAKAELQFAPEVNTTSNGLMRGFRDDAVSRFLASLGGTWNTRKITAHILREGHPLFLVGFAAPSPSAPLANRPTARDAARILKSDPMEMKKLDTNQDGVVDAAEWEAGVARKTRELNAAEDAQAASDVPATDPIVSVGCSPDGVFFLADSEKALLSRLDWSAWLGILGGPAAAIASVVYLLQQHNHLAPGVRHLTGLDLNF